MAGFRLDSYEFRREREAGWRQLEKLIAGVEEKGLRSLAAEDLHRLPQLYRGALSSLSVARAISLDKNLLDYLESLAARAYLSVYGAKRDYWHTVVRFFSHTFPRRVRRLGPALAVAAAVLVLGVLCGAVLVTADPDLWESFVPAWLAGGRSPASSREELLAVLRGEVGESSGLSFFASALFTHNAQIGFLCFALGFAAGVPVILLLFSNGVLLGAFAALHHRVGLGLEFWAWVLPHGVSELLALCLCAAAGLSLGSSLLFPGPYRRLDSLARQGREAAAVVLGSVALFLLAGLLEGYFRQLVVADVPRLGMALATALFWVWYFARRHGGEA